MSINSICSNPKILNEVIAKVSAQIPTEGIETLDNTDFNVIVFVSNNEGSVNLNNNIDVTKINNGIYSNVLYTDTIKANNNSLVLETTQNTSILCNSNNYINLNVGQNTIQITPSIIDFTGCNLKNVAMKNPFFNDGTQGQVLTTNGTGEIYFSDKYEPVKNIFNICSNITDPQIGTTNIIYNSDVSGFTVGKTSIIEFSITINQTIANTIEAVCRLNNTNQDLINIECAILSHQPFKLIFKVPNTATTQNVNITLYSSGANIITNSFDYYSINIYEN